MSTMIYIYYVIIFFQPNLTHEGFKDSKEDPLLIRWVERHTQFCRKEQYDHKKRIQKFKMATYTKEIVTLT